eukprot:XP_011408998.1 PREDICTED: uncharacterized protein LOC105315919 [Amphimedon queenslandica]
MVLRPGDHALRLKILIANCPRKTSSQIVFTKADSNHIDSLLALEANHRKGCSRSLTRGVNLWRRRRRKPIPVINHKDRTPMSSAIPPSIAYVNGHFLAASEASVSIFDRGFLFADAIYEVSSVLEGGLVDNAPHLARLQRSMGEIGLSLPLELEEIPGLQRELIRRNRLQEGLVYLQLTRGPANRDFAFPASPQPTLVMFVQHKSIVDNPAADKGISIIVSPDIRWARRDIKTVSLLAASMAKQAALDAGADDTWMVENDRITEGSSNNAWIVGAQGNLITRHLGSDILPGITRSVVLRLAQEEGLEVEERPFSVAEAKSAREAFSTSAASFVVPVVRIDDSVIGDGKPGPLTREIRSRYLQSARSSARSDIDEARSSQGESR